MLTSSLCIIPFRTFCNFAALAMSEFHASLLIDTQMKLRECGYV